MRQLVVVLVLAAAVLASGCTDNRSVPVEPGDDGVFSTASGVDRSVEEFLAAQGTFCIPDGGGGCVLFVPPIENFLGWFDPSNGSAASIDYAGLGSAWLEAESGGAVSLGTTITGSVVERELADGRAHVSVVLHVKDALTWVAGDFDFTGILLFGARAPEVLAGAAPSVGDGQVQFEFTNTAVGAPLPDIMQLLFDPGPGQEILGARIRMTAFGELRAASGHPDGTLGIMNLKQISAFVPGGGAVSDGFPVEFIRLKALSTPVK